MATSLFEQACFVFGKDRVSPAQALSLSVGETEDGWPDYVIFRVGDIVATPDAKMYRVLGFTRDDHLLVTQHGLKQDPRIRGLELEVGPALEIISR